MRLYISSEADALPLRHGHASFVGVGHFFDRSCVCTPRGQSRPRSGTVPTVYGTRTPTCDVRGIPDVAVP